jgi:hypothetical protein
VACKEIHGLVQLLSCKGRNKQLYPSKDTIYFVPHSRGNMRCATSSCPQHTTVSAPELEILKNTDVHSSDPGPDEESDDEDVSIMYRATIDFSAYKDFKLHPLKDVELPKPDDGGLWNLMSICMYPLTISRDWRMREGGILCALAEYGDFFNCILVYHNGKRKSTTIDEWDTLFRKLQNSEYRKNLIPCMVGASIISVGYLVAIRTWVYKFPTVFRPNRWVSGQELPLPP